MNSSEQLRELKKQISALIRSNSDRGFLPYGACDRVCYELSVLSEEVESLPDRRYVLNAQLIILIAAVKIISHADTSSGMVTEVIRNCIHTVDGLSHSAEKEDRKFYFDAILKAVNHKAFQDWEECGYDLLHTSVHVMEDSKQADRVFAMFPILGPMYSGEAYPETHLITYDILQRLEGEASANRYMMDHIEVDEIREIAVEKALEAKQYELVEQLCMDAMKKAGNRSSRISQWAQYLEKLYTEISDMKKLSNLVRQIVLQGNGSYYSKLKNLYMSQGIWSEDDKQILLQELSRIMFPSAYAELLGQEGEFHELLKVVQNNPYLIQDYGKQLANPYKSESNRIYEEYILMQSADATDRRMYKGVCKLISSYSKAIGPQNALIMIDRLSGIYPRRPAMLDELEKIRAKIARGSHKMS
jgi:hypothetical protein